jgi:hypothetical protein
MLFRGVYKRLEIGNAGSPIDIGFPRERQKDTAFISEARGPTQTYLQKNTKNLILSILRQGLAT